MRRVTSLVVGAVAAALGAVILGEYQLTGFTPFVAGPLFGVIVAELVTATGGRRDTVAVAASAVLAVAGMVWAAWISAGDDWGYVAGAAWVGVALAPVAAVLWIRTPGRPAAGSRRDP